MRVRAPMVGSSYEAAKEVASANRAFYRAFEALDLDAMRAVWLDAPTVKCVHPGWEMLVGSELVMRSWHGIFRSTESIGFDLVDLSIEVAGELGWVTGIERVTSGGSSGELLGEMAVTNLFRRTASGWRMVVHHASPIARRVMGPGA